MNTTVIANSSLPDMMLMNGKGPFLNLYFHTRYKDKISDCPLGHWAKLFGPIGLFNIVLIFFDNIMVLYREDIQI